MHARLRTHPHLEYRPSGFHWRRRWPRRILAAFSPETKHRSIIFPLHTHVMPDAKALTQKISLLSDVAFAGVTERTMGIAPDDMERLPVELCRFQIAAAVAAREAAPARSPETAAYELACANATLDSLRTAIATRDREMARAPLQNVAARLGVALDEDDPDWRRLACGSGSWRQLEQPVETVETGVIPPRADDGAPFSTGDGNRGKRGNRRKRAEQDQRISSVLTMRRVSMTSSNSPAAFSPSERT